MRVAKGGGLHSHCFGQNMFDVLIVIRSRPEREATPPPLFRCLASSSSVLAIVPMFHANGWGTVFAAPLVGARLILPGRWKGRGLEWERGLFLLEAKTQS